MDLTEFIRTNDNNLREGRLSIENYIHAVLNYLQTNGNRENSRMLFGLKYLFINSNDNRTNVALGIYDYPFENADGVFVIIMEKMQ